MPKSSSRKEKKRQKEYKQKGQIMSEAPLQDPIDRSGDKSNEDAL